MPNKNYVRGRRKEYKIVTAAKIQGKIAFRSAGSHSPIDVVIIDMYNKEIELVQSKPKSMSDNAKLRLFDQHKGLSGEYKVTFKVV